MDEFTPRKKKLYVLGKPVTLAAPHASIPEAAVPKLPSTRTHIPTPSKRLLPYSVAAMVTLCIPLGVWLFQRNTTKTTPISTSIVPDSIIKSVSYKIYYPNQAKLPKGYTFDKGSFSTPVKNGVTYAVNYPGNNKIVFSLQSKPSDSELQSFKANFIPLSNEVRTSLGQADIGAYNQQTLVSFPLNDGPWIVITAPSDINQDRLKEVLNSLTL